MNDLLTFLIALPLCGALVIMCLPRTWACTIRQLSVGVMIAEFGLSLWLLTGDYIHDASAGINGASLQFFQEIPWIEALGISYKVGIDGISLWMLLLTTLLSPISLYISWNSVTTKLKEYAIAFLLLEAGMIGAFCALDLFLFYVFWELMLVPMYLIIGMWGGPQRVYAALKFFLYTMAGSLLMLVAILYLVATYHGLQVEAGVPYWQAFTFDLAELQRVVLPFSTQVVLFAAFAFAFAIKIPLFPFHTWLPDAHVQAPTGGSVILAAVLLKFGAYGYVRFAMPLFPLASHTLGPSLVVLGLIGIVYGALCAWVQKDLKKLVAYSSVSHMGFIVLGIFAMNPHGVEGAILQMINHGVSTGALFILVGVIYERRHTRQLDEFGGLAKVMPWFALLFVVVTLSSIGLPGTNGFVGEFMILSGSFLSDALAPWNIIFTLCAATGVIFAAIYMLHAVLRIFWGPVNNPKNEGLADISAREARALAPLIALIFWTGLYPGFFLDRMDASVDHFIQDFQRKMQWSNQDDQLRLLEPGRVGLPVSRPKVQPAETAEAAAGGTNILEEASQ